MVYTLLIHFSPNAIAGEATSNANDFRVVVQFAVVLAVEGKDDTEDTPASAGGVEVGIEGSAGGDRRYLHSTRASGCSRLRDAGKGSRTYEIGAKESHSVGNESSDLPVGRATASGYTRQMEFSKSGSQEVVPEGHGSADEDSGVPPQVIGGFLFYECNAVLQ